MQKKLSHALFILLAGVALAGCIKPIEAPAVEVGNAKQTTAIAGEATLPHFSNSGQIDNPFSPLSHYAQTLFLGLEEGEPNRVEVTLLPESKIIDLHGEQISALVLQVLDSTDGEVIEVAHDFYAQADDGSVYFLGEAVDNYEDGKLVDQEGSWLAGEQGAEAILIMPGQPSVGVFYRVPASAADAIYQSREIVNLNQPTTLPDGTAAEGVLVKETLTDGTEENNIFVSGIGVVETQSDEEQLHLVLASKRDAQSGEIPSALNIIEAQAEDLIDFLPSGNWGRIHKNVTDISEAWQSYQPQISDDAVPQPLQDAMQAALDELEASAEAEDEVTTHQAANDVSAALMDLFAIYQPATPMDLGRLDVLGRQVVLDVAANDFDAAANTLVKTKTIWERLKPIVLAHKGAAVAAQYDASLAIQQAALEAEEGEALSEEASNGLELVDVLEQLF